MIKRKSNPIKVIVDFAKGAGTVIRGKFDHLNVTLTGGRNCRIQDDDPQPGYLLKFRENRPCQGKHSITYHGQSDTPKFTVEQLTAKQILEMGDIVLLEGYNDLNKEPLFVIRKKSIHEDGGEPTNE